MAYLPRAVTPLALWTAGPLRLKPYAICAAGRQADPARLAAAQAHLARALPPEVEAEGDADGIGFAILHFGEDADWLLADWWVRGDSLAQRLWQGRSGTDGEGTGFAALAPRPLVACLWELAVILHERAAFIAAMTGGSPDADAYLANRLPEGCY